MEFEELDNPEESVKSDEAKEKELEDFLTQKKISL